MCTSGKEDGRMMYSRCESELSRCRRGIFAKERSEQVGLHLCLDHRLGNEAWLRLPRRPIASQEDM